MLTLETNEIRVWEVRQLAKGNTAWKWTSCELSLGMFVFLLHSSIHSLTHSLTY